MYILIAILIFGFLILIHEFGHYLTARLFHVQVNEFAIGMGPKLLSRVSKKTGIRYSLRLLPFGGFVSMLGELEESEAEGGEADDSRFLLNRGNTLAAKPGWQKLIVHAAGGVMNILFAFILTLVIVIATRSGTTVIGEFVSPEGATHSSYDDGLRVGDTVLSVAGQRVYISDQLFYQITRYGYTGEPLPIEVRHADGTKETLMVTFPTYEVDGQTLGDIDFRIYAEKKTPASVIKQTFFKSAYMVEMIWESVVDLISGRYTMEAVAGPVGTAGAISSAAKSGAHILFVLTSIISMNLGIFNLLPIPLLDGGHIAYTAIEMATRKKIPTKVIGLLEASFAVLLFGFMIFVTIKDIIKLF